MKEKTMLKNDGPIKVLTDLGDEGKGRVKICFIIEYSRQPTKKGSSEKAKPASGKEGQGIMSEATAKTTPGPREMGKEEKDERNNELVGYEPLYNIQPGVKVKYLTAILYFLLFGSIDCAARRFRDRASPFFRPIREEKTNALPHFLPLRRKTISFKFTGRI